MRLARLTQRKQFLAAAEHGRRFRSSAFTAQVLDAPLRDCGDAPLRLGLTASRKAGNAVKRNRIRRRLRAAATQALAGQAQRPCDIVIIARPETLGAGFGMLVAEISVALDRAKPAGKHSAGKHRGRASGERRPQGASAS
jgi:ribonuclease P protein component